MKAVLILGAGYSKAVAGLPLTTELFDVLPQSKSEKARAEHKQVQECWMHWKKDNPEKLPEQWMSLIATDPLPALQYGVTWDAVLRFVTARVVTLPRGSNAAYYNGITTPSAIALNRQFWTFFRSRFDIRGVITTNYDILAEQGLHRKYAAKRSQPLFLYGGFPSGQKVRKMRDVVKRLYDEVPLGTEISLCKLHGSINWAWEPCGPGSSPILKVHDDVRAAVRIDPKRGEVAIVAPLPEKTFDPVFTAIWNTARWFLSNTPLWIVYGHALNEFDHAVRGLFKEAAEANSEVRIVVMDRSSQIIEDRWRAIAPRGSRVDHLPVLPETLVTSHWNDIGLLHSN
jgi:hypothetical protein